jgi:tetratricopeptide (TPR) repeat protein
VRATTSILIIAAMLCLALFNVAVAQTAPELSVPRARIEAGEYASAIVRLEAFIKARPQDAEARYLLARAYYLQGGLANFERAEESIRSAIRITGSKPEYEWLYGLILVGQGKASAGLSRLRVAASADPRGPSAAGAYRYAMDWGLIAWREFDQALTALTRAISTLERANAPKSHPGFSAAYYWRGRVFEAMGKFIEARSDYTAALDHDPNFAPAKEALEGVSAR